MESSTDKQEPSTAGGDDERIAVLDTFRFAWTLAELRGRYRLGPRHVALRQDPEGSRADRAIPLASERSEREQKIEAQATLAALATDLGLDCKHGALKLDQKIVKEEEGDRPVTDIVKRVGREIDEASRDGADATQAPAWNVLTEVLYRWDAHVQDELVKSPVRASAYQLGRALAETYWALDERATDDKDWRSWSFLL